MIAEAFHSPAVGVESGVIKVSAPGFQTPQRGLARRFRGASDHIAARIGGRTGHSHGQSHRGAGHRKCHQRHHPVAQDLGATAAFRTDDILRQVPGFSLFRRTTSRTANPTAQGVSLRGLGASGASRALVLSDGFPLNDPFGGWVYWDRVPRVSIRSIEVASGGASHLYGSDALGGVINILRTPVEPGCDFARSRLRK